MGPVRWTQPAAWGTMAPMAQGNGYEIRRAGDTDALGNMVLGTATGRLLGGVGHNDLRAWCYPLNTPRGLGVAQEYPFDHAFHNGVFVAQARVVRGGVLSNYWVVHPDWRSPDAHVYNHLGQLRYRERAASVPLAHGYRFTYRTTWNGADGRPVLDEVRHFDLYAAPDATICDVISRKTAAYGALSFEANKHGSLGVRVQPQLLPPFGGEIVAGRGEELWRGGADEVAFGKERDFVAYEAQPTGLGRFGVCLQILSNSASDCRTGPWFIRDYGMAMFNATMSDEVVVAEGETWEAALRVVAYDGAVSVARARAWEAAQCGARE